LNPSYVKTGAVSATSINVDVSGAVAGPLVVGGNTLVGVVEVAMTANYDRSIPPGFPRAPFLTGGAVSDYPQRLSSGTHYNLIACEAAALISAGFATFVVNH
jgi:hypothetical protein